MRYTAQIRSLNLTSILVYENSHCFVRLLGCETVVDVQLFYPRLFSQVTYHLTSRARIMAIKVKAYETITAKADDDKLRVQLEQKD